MLEQAKERARRVLREKEADAFLGLLQSEAEIRPALFLGEEDVEALVLEPKVQMAKIALRIIKAAQPEFKLAVMCRGCDERALRELDKINQLEFNKLLVVGLACSAEQAAECLCRRPCPSRVDIGQAVAGVDPFQDDTLRALFDGGAGARMEKWAAFFQGCKRCYRCRNACPLCICEPCKLKDECWVSRGEIPPEPLAFHLIRAMHLADRCVACGACQEACPADIPLLALHIFLREAIRENYNYEAGVDVGRKSPLLSDFTREPEAGVELPAWENSLAGHHG